MTRKRLLVLSLGPPLLIGGAYTLSQPWGERTSVAAGVQGPTSPTRDPEDREPSPGTTRETLSAAAALRGKLPSAFETIVRPPFVLAGDLSEAELDRLYRDHVQPVTEALWRAYFDQRPNRTVSIIALSNEATFREVARTLDGYETSAYAGYTQRGAMRIVVNLETGTGTLAHELAHVLAVFDFPGMPEWFDEGLAALHEESQFSADRLTLEGTSNWRCQLLRDALRSGEIPSLADVLQSRSIRGDSERLNYAVVRSVCLYLQERGVLSHYYRKLRAAAATDRTGVATLCELLGATSLEQVDEEFQSWIGGGPES
ncbi:MAG: hypothetical protein ACKV0T_21100 [Planctomycetales bacterium]